MADWRHPLELGHLIAAIGFALALEGAAFLFLSGQLAAQDAARVADRQFHIEQRLRIWDQLQAETETRDKQREQLGVLQGEVSAVRVMVQAIYSQTIKQEK
jgi:hypothetical protein